MSLEPHKPAVQLFVLYPSSETCEANARFPGSIVKADKASMRGKAKRLTRRRAYL